MYTPLHTQGVPVVALGQAEVPAFFTPSSGVPAHVQLETTSQVGALLAAHVQAGLQNGVLVTVPYTDEAALADELDACTSVRELYVPMCNRYNSHRQPRFLRAASSRRS